MDCIPQETFSYVGGHPHSTLKRVSAHVDATDGHDILHLFFLEHKIEMKNGKWKIHISINQRLFEIVTKTLQNN